VSTKEFLFGMKGASLGLLFGFLVRGIIGGIDSYVDKGF